MRSGTRQPRRPLTACPAQHPAPSTGGAARSARRPSQGRASPGPARLQGHDARQVPSVSRAWCMQSRGASLTHVGPVCAWPGVCLASPATAVQRRHATRSGPTCQAAARAVLCRNVRQVGGDSFVHCQGTPSGFATMPAGSEPAVQPAHRPPARPPTLPIATHPHITHP